MHATPPEPDPGCPSTSRHGTLTAYHRDRCRCPRARSLSAREKQQYLLRKARGVEPTVDPIGTRRRITALIAAGWTYRHQADYLGVTRGAVMRHVTGRRTATRTGTAAAVRRMYDDLSGRPGPSNEAKVWARTRGYVPPIGWDDDDIDDPAARPWQGLDDEGRTVTSPPAPWDADDLAAVGRIVARLRAAHPGRPDSTVRSEAYRVHYRRTGRVRSHGRQGWVSGCRCPVCETQERAPRVGGAAQQHAGAAS